MGLTEIQAKAVGPQLAAVLPPDHVRWWKRSLLRRLNYSLIFLFLFSSANGYDGSMMNGLQALPQWQEFMNHPTYVLYLLFTRLCRDKALTVPL